MNRGIGQKRDREKRKKDAQTWRKKGRKKQRHYVRVSEKRRKEGERHTEDVVRE